MRIKKALALVLLVLFAAVGLASCSAPSEVVIEVGETYQTKWFEFTIDSIEKVDAYAGYEAAEDHELYLVLVTEKNIVNYEIDMGTFDFCMDDDTWPEWIWGMDPLDDTMMPEHFLLEPNETAQYYMLFEVLEDTPELMLLYTERDEEGNIGTTFKLFV